MKILYITNLYPPHHIGGYELICANVNAHMQSRGHETLVLTSDHGVDGGEEAGSESGVRRSLRIHGMYGHPWLGIAKLRDLEFHNNEILRRTLREFRPDVVHVFNLGGLSKSLALTLQRAGVPTAYFVSDHWIAQSLAADVWLGWWNREDGSVAHRALRSWWAMAGKRDEWDRLAPTEPRSAIQFRRIYFCSDFLRRRTAEAGYDVAHGAVIHNAVDTRRFTGQAAPSERPLRRLLYAGRIAPDKGVDTLLRGFASAAERMPLSLTVCGAGNPTFESQLRSFVSANRLDVSFRRATPGEMPQVYREHDALVFPSEWDEPFALTPLEAMASGLPVIATNTGGSAEIFRDCENALVYSAGDFRDLAAAILLLGSDGHLRRRIAADGQHEVRKNLNEPLVFSQVEDFIQATADEWHCAPAGREVAA